MTGATTATEGSRRHRSSASETRPPRRTELARLVERGARLVVLRPAPVVSASGMRSLGDPTHDRVWALAAEAGVVVAFHAADSGYGRYAADWGERASVRRGQVVGVRRDPVDPHPAADLRHDGGDGEPRRVRPPLGLCVSRRWNWVPDGCRTCSSAWRRRTASRRRASQADPLDTFREHVWVTPFYEDAIARPDRPSRRGPRADGVGLAASRGAADARRVRRRRGGVARRHPPPDPAGEPARVGRPGCLGRSDRPARRPTSTRSAPRSRRGSTSTTTCWHDNGPSTRMTLPRSWPRNARSRSRCSTPGGSGTAGPRTSAAWAVTPATAAACTRRWLRVSCRCPSRTTRSRP